MKISECKMCSLCKSREHICHPFGKRPSNVMIIIGKESTNEYAKINENGIIDALKRKLKDDLYVTYVIKCSPQNHINKEHLLKCRLILKREMKLVKPYLLLLIGRIAVIAVLGSKYKEIYQNVFFIKDNKRIFVCEGFDGNRDKLNRNLKHLEKYIDEYYK